MEKFYEIPKNEIVDKLSRILNIKGIVNPDKSEILAALVKYENSNADILDCMLAAKSFPHRVIVSFDKDFKKEKAMEEKITYRRPDEKECNAYYAIPAAGETAPGVVVLQEWWGLNDQIKGVADRLTEVGYRALVPDLYRGKVTLEAAEAEHLMRNLDFGDAATTGHPGGRTIPQRDQPEGSCHWFLHGFGNETGEHHDPEVTKLAWQRTLDFLAKHIK